SPAGAIPPASPAGRYLLDRGIDVNDFNSYGSRRGNDRVMVRGTFANIRLVNRLAPGTEGGLTCHQPDPEQMWIYDAAERYRREEVPLIVIAGKEYGTGSSRDWAAKGTALLGVRAVLAESFERIHRSNLVGMGVLPLQFLPGETAQTLQLTGKESYTMEIDDNLQPRQTIRVRCISPNGRESGFDAICRIDTRIEIDYYRHGGILPAVVRQCLKKP
ncbi:aconitate hydratase, partial [candidate division KSB1 bacterium]|nr:aconitate hydratase [candidate division KSB1 bacterium]